MKTTIKGQKIKRTQAGIEANKLLLNMSLPELGLEMDIELTEEKNTIMDNLQEATILQCEQYQNDENALFDNRGNKLTKYALANIVTSIIYSAIDQLSTDWRSVFTCYISEAKDKLRSYLNKQYSVEHNKTFYTITNRDLLEFLKIEEEQEEEVQIRSLEEILLENLARIEQIVKNGNNAPINGTNEDIVEEVLPVGGIPQSLPPSAMPTDFVKPVEAKAESRMMNVGSVQVKVNPVQVSAEDLARHKRRKKW